MDKIAKAIAKLSKKEQVIVKTILVAILSSNIKGLDVKKLRGHKDIYRIRKGPIRIIYQDKDNGAFILSIERRSEKTYRDF